MAAAFLSCGVCPAKGGSIRVVDENNKRVPGCYIYHENGKAEKARVGRTDANGICAVTESGKPGERYIAVSEEYNPSSTDCPVASAVIRVQRTTLLSAYTAKGEFFEAVGEPAAAAVQFRRAAVMAEKNHNYAVFNALEYRVAASVAKVLQVEQPFVMIEDKVAPSQDFKITLKEYQRSREMKPTGAVNSVMLRDLAAIEASTVIANSYKPATTATTTTTPTIKATGSH